MNFGGMAERFKASVLKTDVPKGTGGSNPSAPTTFRSLEMHNLERFQGFLFTPCAYPREASFLPVFA